MNRLALSVRSSASQSLGRLPVFPLTGGSGRLRDESGQSGDDDGQPSLTKHDSWTEVSFGAEDAAATPGAVAGQGEAGLVEMVGVEDSEGAGLAPVPVPGPGHVPKE
jgi:hypothetical protein